MLPACGTDRSGAADGAPADAAPADSTVAAALDSLLASLHERGWFSGAVVAGRHGDSIRHLITHQTGGLPEYGYFWKEAGDDGVLNHAFLLDVLARRQPPLSHPVGARFQYDDMGFYMAALIIERIAGVPFDRFLEERFFRPLGMDSPSHSRHRVRSAIRRPAV